jgi:GPH family glycoside/pentoside/hexuronide:cation symporter
VTRDAAPPLSRRVLLAYALPAVVVSLPIIPVYIHLPTLYGIELGLGLTAVGWILLAARLFDTVTDPLVGALSDRTRIAGCRRKPWIAAGAVIAGGGLWQVLMPPDGAGAAYLLIWSMVLYGGWTMVAVPYLTWGAELSGDYHERSRITSWREAMGLIGIVGAAALSSSLTEAGRSERDAMAAIVWVAVLGGAALIPLLLRAVPEQAAPRPLLPATPVRVRSALIGLVCNKPFVRLLFAWFANGLANGIPAVLFLIYLQYGLGAGPDQRAQFILVYFLAAVISIPVWLMLVRRLDKHRLWCLAMIAACLAFAAVPLLPAGAFAAFAVVCVVTGAALGADLSLPPAIQADVIDYGRLRDGADRAGLQFAFWGMSTKLALAAAVGLALPGVAALGFDPDAPSRGGTVALIMIYAVVPIVIKGVAIGTMWRFPLTAARQRAIRRRLA